MAVNILHLSKPKLFLSLEAGGSLPDNTYYLAGYFQGAVGYSNGAGYYGSLVSAASDEVSITTSGSNNSIKIVWGYDVESGLTIENSPTSGYMRVTEVGHSRTNGDKVYIDGSSNCDGQHTVANSSTDYWEFAQTWTNSDNGDVYKNDLPDNADGIMIKWDTSTLLSGGIHKPWGSDATYGHRRWSHYYTLAGFTGSDVTITSISTGSQTGSSLGETSTNYRSGKATGGGGLGHPEIAINPNNDFGDSFGLPIDEGKIAVEITTSGHDYDDIKDAIRASDYEHLCLITQYKLSILGFFCGDGASTIENVDIDFLAGCNKNANLTFDNCVISVVGIGQVYYSRGIHIDTRVIAYIYSMQPYQYSGHCDFTNTEIYTYSAGWTVYQNLSGLILPFNSTSRYLVIQYPRGTAGYDYYADLVIKKAYLNINLLSYTWSEGDLVFEDITFQDRGSLTYDVWIRRLATHTNQARILEFINVRNLDEDDGFVLGVKFTSHTYFADHECKYYFQPTMIVKNTNDDFVENAKIRIENTNGDIALDTTDANGEGEVKILAYKYVYNGSSSPNYCDLTSYMNLVITVDCPGYESYKATIKDLRNIDINVVIKNSPFSKKL